MSDKILNVKQINTWAKLSDVSEVFQCDCEAPEHMVKVNVTYWSNDEAEFCLQVTADNFLPWYKRIIPSIKFLFGYPSLKWHDVMLKDKDVKRLENIIKDYNIAKRN